MSNKFYAVKVGKTPGIYETWDECKEMVHQFPGAIYKSFKTHVEAEAYMGYEAKDEAPQKDGSEDISKINYDNGNVIDISEQEKVIDTPYAFVDGSYNISNGTYGYGGFLVSGNKKYFLSGSGNDAEMASMRNVAGEILGCRAAIMKAIELKLDQITIYYDYEGIEKWALGEWKRNKKGTIEYYDFISSIRYDIALYFVKVKGHSGIEGNEEADLLAKRAVGI